jgi:hypothetical protein
MTRPASQERLPPIADIALAASSGAISAAAAPSRSSSLAMMESLSVTFHHGKWSLGLEADG